MNMRINNVVLTFNKSRGQPFNTRTLEPNPSDWTGDLFPFYYLSITIRDWRLECTHGMVEEGRSWLDMIVDCAKRSQELFKVTVYWDGRPGERELVIIFYSHINRLMERRRRDSIAILCGGEGGGGVLYANSNGGGIRGEETKRDETLEGDKDMWDRGTEEEGRNDDLRNRSMCWLVFSFKREEKFDLRTLSRQMKEDTWRRRGNLK